MTDEVTKPLLYADTIALGLKAENGDRIRLSAQQLESGHLNLRPGEMLEVRIVQQKVQVTRKRDFAAFVEAAKAAEGAPEDST